MELHADSPHPRHCEEAQPTKPAYRQAGNLLVSCHVERSETSLKHQVTRFIEKITTPACRQAGRHRGHGVTRRFATSSSLRGGAADEACLPAGRQSLVSCHVERSE